MSIWILSALQMLQIVNAPLLLVLREESTTVTSHIVRKTCHIATFIGQIITDLNYLVIIPVRQVPMPTLALTVALLGDPLIEGPCLFHLHYDGLNHPIHGDMETVLSEISECNVPLPFWFIHQSRKAGQTFSWKSWYGLVSRAFTKVWEATHWHSRPSWSSPLQTRNSAIWETAVDGFV